MGINIKEVALEEVVNQLTNRPGLVFGPDVTMNSVIAENLLREVKQKLYPNLDHLELEKIALQLDQVKVSSPSLFKQFYGEYVECLESLSVPSDIPFLVAPKWSLCISLTQDRIFEKSLSDFLDTLPSSKAVSIVDTIANQPSSRSLPVYKLFGYYLNTSHEGGVAISTSEILSKFPIWPHLLATATDNLKAGPLIFIGTKGLAESVRNLLSVIASLPKPHPSKLMFLKDDPILEDPTIGALVRQFASVEVVNATAKEFCNKIASLPPIQKQFNFNTDGNPVGKEFLNFSEFISEVPSYEIGEAEFNSHRLVTIDALFRPTSLDWTPFQSGIDIQRDIAADVEQSVIFASRKAKGNAIANSILVRGDAGVGKTTLLKRVAYNLEKQGLTVLWGHRSPVVSWAPTFKKISDLLNELHKANKERKFVFIFDDPWSLRIHPGEMLGCFDRCQANCAFIFSFRNSDYFNTENSAYSLPGDPSDNIELPSILSEREQNLLAECLIKIGAASDLNNAWGKIKKIPVKNAKDILCSLWFCVPETQKTISNSLQDEYFRLGESARAVELLAQGISNSRAAKNAYEIVAVTSNLGIAIPMEVLVRSIKIDYGEFIDMNSTSTHLWGLIYAEEDLESETIVYWARNEVVVKVLLKIMNGPTGGHTGEFRALRSIVESCEIGSKLYRDFLISLLVRSRYRLEEMLNFDQGLELYNLALSNPGVNDKLLEHHKGVWMQHKGNDYVGTYNQFKKALRTQEYRESERETVTEQINTSMASCVVQMVKALIISPEDGFELVQDHIQQSRSAKAVNPHQRHISANNLYEFAVNQCDVGQAEQTGYPALIQSLQEIENTLVTIGPSALKDPKHEKTLAMFYDLYNKVINTIPDIKYLEKFSEESFDSIKSQVGFELLIRKELANAMKGGKGKDYNKVSILISEIIVKIEKTGEKVSDRIIAARVDLLIRWKLQKPNSAMDWNLFKKDLVHLLDTPMFRDDVSKKFYYAVALYHTVDIESANTMFAGLRGMRTKGLSNKDIRCVYIGPEGFPKRFECFQEDKHGPLYVSVMELGTDIHVSSAWQHGGQHCYVGFTLNGPIALKDRPEDKQFLLG